MRALRQQVVGGHVRFLRLRTGISLRTLAKRTGFTPSFISQLENGLVSPSIASMEKLAGVLGVSLGEFFSAAIGGDAAQVVRAQDRASVPSAWSHASLELLGPVGEGHGFEPMLITLEPGGRSSKHPVAPGQEEFAFVVEGEVVATLGPDELRLGAGDAVTVRAGELRRYENRGTANARILVIRARATVSPAPGAPPPRKVSKRS